MYMYKYVVCNMKVFDAFDTCACTLLDVAKQLSCMNVICKLVSLHKSLCNVRAYVTIQCLFSLLCLARI